jgi:predicted 2-oxoglutarate/Fe(II)-dependent dioxygenase YbiX/peroxiredoxin
MRAISQSTTAKPPSDAKGRSYVIVEAGDPAPTFFQRSTSNPRYAFHSAAGRYLVLCFFASTRDASTKQALKIVQKNKGLFDDLHASFFGVTLDAADEKSVREELPGRRYFFDFDGTISRLYGSVPIDSKSGEANVPVVRKWVVTDPTQRVLATFAFAGDDGGAAKVMAYVKALPPPARFAGIALQAPILYLPRVFEPELCTRLIDAYKTSGGEESGFMRDVEGKTVLVNDYNHKRRRDHMIEDQPTMDLIQSRIRRRIVPEIKKIHQFEVTRMERYLVACYRAEDAAHFQPHRDNTTKGTAHRRFAVSINLNDDFEGGEIGFPEYGPQTFKPPAGAAVVFSCSMLHTVTTMKRGNRFAFLPFLYDDAAAKIREENLKFLEVPGKPA